MSWHGLRRKAGIEPLQSALSGQLSSMMGAILASSLARNAYALMSSIVATSALGMLFWLLAGRLFEQATVGIASVLINSALTISVATRLSLNNVLQRFLPGTGQDANRLVCGALAIGAAFGFLAAFAFSLLAGTFMPDLAFLAESWELPIVFAMIVAVWAVYSLLESTFSALRAAHWVPVFSITSSILKIGALVAASMVAANALGLLVAWIVPIMPAVCLGIYLVFWVLLPRATQDGKPMASIATMARFCSFDYLAGLAPTIAIAAAPLIVLNYSGPETTAQFYIGWLIAYSIYLMGHSMGISLLAESVVASERIASLSGQALVQAALPITVLAVGIAMAAPFLMALFGPDYQIEGTLILQLLALSCIPWVLETIFLAVARAKDWLPAILGVQWLNLGLVLSLGLFLVPQTGGWGMAAAWLIAQTITVVVILAGTILTFGPSRTLNTIVILFGGVSSVLRGMFGASDNTAPIGRFAANAATQSSRRDGGPMGVQEDEKNPGADRVSAVRHLRQAELSALAVLRGDPRLEHFRPVFADIAAPEAYDPYCGRSDGRKGRVDGTHLIECAVNWRPSFASAVDIIAQIHALTASPQSVSAQWIDAWIRQPLRRIERMAHYHDSAGTRAVLALLEAHMVAYWSDRSLDLGITHCNFVPSTIVFGDAKESHWPPISTIGGWSHMRQDGPAGFDICHLALTTRMAVRDQELGPNVYDLLDSGTWPETERQWLAHESAERAWLSQDDDMREMIILAWVNHLARNISVDPALATNRVWGAINLGWPLRQAKRYVLAI